MNKIKREKAVKTLAVMMTIIFAISLLASLI